MNLNDPILQVIRRLDALEAEFLGLESLAPLYTILNEAAAQNVTGDHNNFSVGDYDVLFLVPTANRIIRGLTGGVRGRMLWIRNVSASFTLTFTHQDAAATAENRIGTPSGGNIILGTRQTAIFLYVNDANAITGATRWLLLIPGA